MAHGTACRDGSTLYNVNLMVDREGQSVLNVSGTQDVSRDRQDCSVEVAAWTTSESVGDFEGIDATASCKEMALVRGTARNMARKPKSLTVERVSDYSQRLSWMDDHSDVPGTHPWTALRINRAVDLGAMVNIAVTKSTAVSYTDNSTEPGHMYSYYIESFNSAGSSAMVGPATVYTAPVAPTRADIVRKPDGNVEVTMTGHSEWWDDVQAQISDGGSGWSDSLAAYTADDGVIIVTVAAPSSDSGRFRLRIMKDGLASGWVETVEIIGHTAPLAPRVTGLESVYDSGETVAVSWVPNHQDCSEQEEAQVEFTMPDGFGGTAPYVIDVVGADTTAQIDSSPYPTGRWTVRVRTKGSDALWGEWSSPLPFEIAPETSVWFTKPGMDGEVVGELPLDATWEVANGYRVSHQVLSLINSQGLTIALYSMSGNEREETVGDYGQIRNGESYSLRIDLRSGSEIVASATRSFTTDWVPPAPAIVDVVFDENLAANITVDQSAASYRVKGTSLLGPISREGGKLMFGGNVSVEEPSVVVSGVTPATSFDVVKIMPDGTRRSVAAGIKPGDTVTDPLPPLNTEFVYEVTSYSESGQTNTVTCRTVCRSRFAALNFGRDAGEFMRTGLDAEFDFRSSHSRETYHFATGSRSCLPFRYDVYELDVSMRASWTLLDRSSADAAMGISRRHSWGWFRGLDGNISTVSVDINVVRSASGLRSWRISADMVESMWEDPVNGYV